jgi:hypothetical protein
MMFTLAVRYEIPKRRVELKARTIEVMLGNEVYALRENDTVGTHQPDVLREA